MKELLKIIKNGIIQENAIFSLVLGLCPSLAVTTSAKNGLGMGLAFIFVQVCSEAIISLVRNLVVDKVRIPVFLAVIAGFVTFTDLTLKAYFPVLAKSLGIFVPLIVVNCIVLGRIEVYGSKNPPANAIADGLGIGIGFTLVITFIGALRELIGAGKIFDIPVLLGLGYKPMGIMILPPGGFFTIGIMMAVIAYIRKRQLLFSDVTRPAGDEADDILGEEPPDDIARADYK